MKAAGHWSKLEDAGAVVRARVLPCCLDTFIGGRVRGALLTSQANDISEAPDLRLTKPFAAFSINAHSTMRSTRSE